MKLEARNLILVGDVRERLSDLPDESIQCVVTSPPYWALRDYGAAGQIGQETTPDEYVEALVAVFRDVRRVLRADGIAWLNLGDTYASGGAGQHSNGRGFRDGSPKHAQALQTSRLNGPNRSTLENIKPKDLIGIPWEVALALRRDGWYLRSDVVWSKPNPMPESVTDRPTKTHEYLFLLTKSERYFYDAEAVKEPANIGVKPAGNRPIVTDGLVRPSFNAGTGLRAQDPARHNSVPSRRNRRSVWEIATEPNREEHFATFPKALVRVCLQAGTSERGACVECEAPWARVVVSRQTEGDEDRPPRNAGGRLDGFQGPPDGYQTETRTVGWRPTCDHFDDYYRALPRAKSAERRRRQDLRGEWWERARRRPGLDSWPTQRCVVLDPFMGIGTTGLVALSMFRDYMGVEINPAYARIAERLLAPKKNQGSLL